MANWLPIARYPRPRATILKRPTTARSFKNVPKSSKDLGHAFLRELRRPTLGVLTIGLDLRKLCPFLWPLAGNLSGLSPFQPTASESADGLRRPSARCQITWSCRAEAQTFGPFASRLQQKNFPSTRQDLRPFALLPVQAELRPAVAFFHKLPSEDQKSFHEELLQHKLRHFIGLVKCVAYAGAPVTALLLLLHSHTAWQRP